MFNIQVTILLTKKKMFSGSNISATVISIDYKSLYDLLKLLIESETCTVNKVKQIVEEVQQFISEANVIEPLNVFKLLYKYPSENTSISIAKVSLIKIAIQRKNVELLEYFYNCLLLQFKLPKEDKSCFPAWHLAVICRLNDKIKDLRSSSFWQSIPNPDEFLDKELQKSLLSKDDKGTKTQELNRIEYIDVMYRRKVIPSWLTQSLECKFEENFDDLIFEENLNYYIFKEILKHFKFKEFFEDFKFEEILELFKSEKTRKYFDSEKTPEYFKSEETLRYFKVRGILEYLLEEIANRNIFDNFIKRLKKIESPEKERKRLSERKRKFVDKDNNIDIATIKKRCITNYQSQPPSGNQGPRKSLLPFYKVSCEIEEELDSDEESVLEKLGF